MLLGDPSFSLVLLSAGLCGFTEVSCLLLQHAQKRLRTLQDLQVDGNNNKNKNRKEIALEILQVLKSKHFPDDIQLVACRSNLKRGGQPLLSVLLFFNKGSFGVFVCSD